MTQEANVNTKPNIDRNLPRGHQEITSVDVSVVTSIEVRDLLNSLPENHITFVSPSQITSHFPQVSTVPPLISFACQIEMSMRQGGNTETVLLISLYSSLSPLDSLVLGFLILV